MPAAPELLVDLRDDRAPAPLVVHEVPEVAEVRVGHALDRLAEVEVDVDRLRVRPLTCPIWEWYATRGDRNPGKSARSVQGQRGGQDAPHR